MRDIEILKKAMQKAIDNGWTDDDNVYKPIIVRDNIFVILPEIPHILYEPHFIIFNHDFAKALWGEDNIMNLVSSSSSTSHNKVTKIYENLGEAWKYHLQQMVIAENPIEYLGKNI